MKNVKKEKKVSEFKAELKKKLQHSPVPNTNNESLEENPNQEDFQKSIQDFYSQNKDVYDKIHREILKLPKSQQAQIQNLFLDFQKGKPTQLQVQVLRKKLPQYFKETFEGLISMMEVFSFMGNQPGDVMNVDQAKELILQAVKEGKITQEQADKLLSETPATSSAGEDPTSTQEQSVSEEPKKSIIKQYWNKLFSK